MLPRQKSALDVWSYLLGYFEDNGYMPTLFEIAQRFDICREWARQLVLELERQGKVKVVPNKHRNIVLNLKRSK